MSLCECGCGAATPVAMVTRTRLGHVKGESVRFVRGHNRRGHANSSKHRARQSAALQGELHFNWKGDEVGYVALHQWLYTHKERTGVCEECGKTCKTDFANISGEYHRSIDDYVELCRSCHLKFDRGNLALSCL